MKIKLIKSVSVFNIIAILVAIVIPLVVVNKAEAAVAPMQYTMVRFDRLLTGTATGGTICVQPSVVNLALVDNKIIVAFPSDFGLNTTPANWTTNITNNGWPSGASSVTVTGNVASAVDNVGKTATFTISDLASSSTIYCFNFHNVTTEPLTTGAAAINDQGSVSTQTAASAAIDTGNYAAAIVNGTTGYDQITVSGNIIPTFSFSLTGNSSSFGTIGNTVVNGGSVTGSVVTNARNGWTTWVKDANNGLLHSTTASADIPTPGAVGTNRDISTMGATGAFGLGVATTTNKQVGLEYDGSTFSNKGVGTLSNAFRPIATSTTYTAGETITLTPRVIAATTQVAASDYSDVITIVAAGLF